MKKEQKLSVKRIDEVYNNLKDGCDESSSEVISFDLLLNELKKSKIDLPGKFTGDELECNEYYNHVLDVILKGCEMYAENKGADATHLSIFKLFIESAKKEIVNRYSDA